jgi:hypothetical protein
MHLIKGEDGQMMSHGHTHTHDHEHDHTHQCSHNCDSCDGKSDHVKETAALLTYMLSHNEHHAQELVQMAENLKKLGLHDEAKQISEGVSDFQKGNMRLSVALSLVNEQIKEA